MDTQLFYTLGADRQLSFRLRESVTADPDIEARFRGLLNTTTGAFQYRGTLKKYYATGPIVKGDPTEPLRVGVGAGLASAAGDAPFIAVSARKRVGLLEGRADTFLTAKGRVDIDPTNGKFSRRAGVRVTRRLLNFTARQDLEITAGLDLDWPMGGKKAAAGGGGGGGGGGGAARVRRGPLDVMPYLTVRENNWGVHLRRGAWFLTYDL